MNLHDYKTLAKRCLMHQQFNKQLAVVEEVRPGILLLSSGKALTYRRRNGYYEAAMLTIASPQLLLEIRALLMVYWGLENQHELKLLPK